MWLLIFPKKGLFKAMPEYMKKKKGKRHTSFARLHKQNVSDYVTNCLCKERSGTQNIVWYSNWSQ